MLALNGGYELHDQLHVIALIRYEPRYQERILCDVYEISLDLEKNFIFSILKYIF